MNTAQALWGALLMAGCHLLRSSDLFFRVGAIKALPVSLLIFWEHFFNLVVLAPALWHQRRAYARLTGRDFGLFLLVGWGASAMGILCFTQAFHYMNPALVILLQKLQPLVTISLGAILLRERFRPAFYGWAGLAVTASYFVSFSLTNPFSGEWARLGTGTLFALAAVFFWGSGTVWGKLLLGTYDKVFVLGNRFLFGTVFTFGLALALNSGLQAAVILDPSGPYFASILYMAWVPGLVATGLFYFGLVYVAASVASILELIFPLASVLIMWGYYGQPLDSIQIGAAIVLFISMGRITAADMRLLEDQGSRSASRG
ncbi:MAG: Integral membrane protein [Candidatus Ozemobacter sibiricus]|jgi:drug/metabolite transporter (DMT)-like permease|uniref:Integral membrane protein n=1 Tax=Candidatus Ozemobacter sibiricus TaxID=2268124 RepID=A0A367ZL89_9BACT|nr:MAG: Integral membrane protein [Candidatus Ozemobacter sibiricus]